MRRVTSEAAASSVLATISGGKRRDITTRPMADPMAIGRSKMAESGVTSRCSCCRPQTSRAAATVVAGGRAFASHAGQTASLVGRPIIRLMARAGAVTGMASTTSRISSGGGAMVEIGGDSLPIKLMRVFRVRTAPLKATYRSEITIVKLAVI